MGGIGLACITRIREAQQCAIYNVDSTCYRPVNNANCGQPSGNLHWKSRINFECKEVVHFEIWIQEPLTGDPFVLLSPFSWSTILSET